MPNVANEVPKSGKLGNVQRHRDDLMPGLLMPGSDAKCSASMKTSQDKTLHPMAGRIEAPVRHGQVAHTIPLNTG
jgi:hypothetical protein